MDQNLNTQITKAIAAHASWKRRLRDAIDTGSSDVNVHTAGRDDVCEFGQWLHSGSAAASGASQHRTCLELHARFHKAAADVLQLALEGHKGEAEQRLKAIDSEFNAASAALTREMMAWQRVA
jgi:hypothetical protein